LSGRGLCDELITRPEESYRLCCVVVCDLETSRMGAPYIYDISRLRVKAHSRNHCCREKVVNIAYSMCVCVCFLVIQKCNVHAPYDISGLCGCSTFLHVVS